MGVVVLRKETITLSEILGHEGDILEDVPLGKALIRVADALGDYVECVVHTPASDELAESAIALSEMVLDLLEELKILDPDDSGEVIQL